MAQSGIEKFQRDIFDGATLKQLLSSQDVQKNIMGTIPIIGTIIIYIVLLIYLFKRKRKLAFFGVLFSPFIVWIYFVGRFFSGN